MNLDKALLWLSRKDMLSVRDFLRQVLVTGGSGSGKSSGVVQTIARACLKQGFAIVVFVAKLSEVTAWKEYARATGRLDDLIIMEPGGRYKFNFLDYEMNRPGGGESENIVTMFLILMKMGGRVERSQHSGGSHDPFWEQAMREALKYAIELLKLAHQPVTLSDISRIICEAPTEGKQLERFNNLVGSEDSEAYKELDEWSKEYFTVNCLAWASYNAKTRSEERDFEVIKSYFLKDFATLAPNTRTGVIAQLNAFASPFKTGMLAEYFTEETSPEIFPEEIFKGKILIINFAIKKLLQVGIYAQSIYKYLLEQAIERRPIDDNSKPVFLFIDEAQYFLNGQDAFFLPTARDHLASTIVVTQNLNNLYATMSGANPRDQVNSILGNLNLKFFHANDCPDTNAWAANVIGQTFQEKDSFNFNGGGAGGSFSQQVHYQVLPQEFTMLRTGSAVNNFKIDAIISCSGKKFSNGKNYMRVVFEQPKPEKK